MVILRVTDTVENSIQYTHSPTQTMTDWSGEGGGWRVEGAGMDRVSGALSTTGGLGRIKRRRLF